MDIIRMILSPGLASQMSAIKAKLLVKCLVRGEEIVGYDGLVAPP